MTELYRLQALALKNVGVFNELEVHFKPIESLEADSKKAEIHVFTGPNGSGKSTLLYSIAEIFSSLHKNGLPTSPFKRFHSPSSAVEFKFANEAGAYGIRIPNDQGWTTNFGKVQARRNDPNNGFYFAYGAGGLPSNFLFEYKQESYSYNPANSNSQTIFHYAAFAYSGLRSLQDATLDSGIKEIVNSPFESALSFNNTIRSQLIIQWIANNRAQSALAKSDGDKNASEKYDKALTRISNLIEEICDLKIEFSLQRSPLAVKLKVNNQDISFDGLPDGLKSIISWVADLTLRLEAVPWANKSDIFEKPIILLLDEIDIHLHPKWQRRVLPAIQKLLPNAQIFISTHSPFVVGSVEDAWVYKLPEKPESKITLEGVHSGAGKSYGLILQEIFGIDEDFDVETEHEFDEFYSERDKFIQNKSNKHKLLHIAKKLSARGLEIDQIVARELRQVSRITGEAMEIA